MCNFMVFHGLYTANLRWLKNILFNFHAFLIKKVKRLIIFYGQLKVCYLHRRQKCLPQRSNLSGHPERTPQGLCWGRVWWSWRQLIFSGDVHLGALGFSKFIHHPTPHPFHMEVTGDWAPCGEGWGQAIFTFGEPRLVSVRGRGVEHVFWMNKWRNVFHTPPLAVHGETWKHSLCLFPIATGSRSSRHSWTRLAEGDSEGMWV